MSLGTLTIYYHHLTKRSQASEAGTVRISDSPPPRYVNATPVKVGLVDVQKISPIILKVKEKVESRLMSEMRQHLVEMNRKKMLDRGLISERELAIIGRSIK